MCLRRLLAYVLVICFAIGVLPGQNTVVSANKLSELEKEKTEIREKNKALDVEKKEKLQEIKVLEEQISDVEQEVRKLDVEIQEILQQIQNTEFDIQAKNEEITQLKESIKILEERIAERDKLLKERARAIQATGGALSYLDVLLGASSFTDFISRATSVTTIIAADKNILEEHQRDHKELQKNKQALEEQLEELEALKQQQEQQKNAFEAKKAEQEKLLAKLEEEVHQHEQYVMSLEEEQQVLANQEAMIQKAIELEKKRLEEERRKEEERRRAEEQRKKAEQVKQNPGNSGGSPPVSNLPSKTGMIRPTSGPVTSEFGWRWGRMHYGIDLGVPVGTPVYAVADGVVTNSYYSSSYGNVVFVYHPNVNGKAYETVYAHLSSRSVSVGDVVKQGQVVGLSGNTGDSTGPHLHFEVHLGRWNGEKTSAINPRSVINF